MELGEIQALMREFEDSDTRELRIDDGEFHLYLSKNKQNKIKQQATAEQSAVRKGKPEADQDEKKNSQDTASTQTITAPLVGTVYLQPKPDVEPYIKVGDHIKAGQVVCVIEAMKMMTEVKSDVEGTVTQVNVDNEELVEVGQPLFTLTKEEHDD